jgi:hypothetical protein
VVTNGAPGVTPARQDRHGLATVALDDGCPSTVSVRHHGVRAIRCRRSSTRCSQVQRSRRNAGKSSEIQVVSSGRPDETTQLHQPKADLGLINCLAR